MQASKMFVLDTNVLMHDPTSIYRSEEHDVYIPMAVIDELDSHKTGTSEIARNVRQVSRLLNDIITSTEYGFQDGVTLIGLSKGLATGRLFLQTAEIDIATPSALLTHKADNQIISMGLHLKEQFSERARSSWCRTMR